MNKVKEDLGEFPKLSVNDDLKIDRDDKVGFGETIVGVEPNIFVTAFGFVPLLQRRGRVLHHQGVGY